MPLLKPRAAEQDPSAFAKLRCCIYLQNPFADCFCLNISGSKIPRMLDYCVGDYLSCPVFRTRAPLAAGGAEAAERSE